MKRFQTYSEIFDQQYDQGTPISVGVAGFACALDGNNKADSEQTLCESYISQETANCWKHKVWMGYSSTASP